MLLASDLLSASLDSPGTLIRHDPFAFVIAHGVLPDDACSDLARDFPRYTGAGFFPYHEAECGASIRALVDALTQAAFSDAAGARLDIERLSQYPVLVTLCRHIIRRHGTIHTDSASKVATALVYLNESWPDSSDGCLRFLGKVDDIDAMVAPEVKPLYGEFVIFKRADNSFHGHLPCAGERRVIQVAWLTSEAEKLRKTRRGLASRFFKKVAGGLDRKLGAGRDRNAAHRD